MTLLCRMGEERGGGGIGRTISVDLRGYSYADSPKAGNGNPSVCKW